MKGVTAVIGGQYGSEGKGAIVAQIAGEYDVHVRVGGPNAGHTIWHEGKKWKMRSVPCGWVNPDADLVIGAGAVVDLDCLYEEIEELEEAGYGIVDRLLVDHNAALITRNLREWEGGVLGDMHRAIGSTGEGVGMTRIARIARGCTGLPVVDAGYRTARQDYDGNTIDSVKYLNEWADQGRSILLEGTQGSGLSLLHGPWPHVTSADTNVGQLLTDCGLAPALLRGCVLVFRTHPIRVAGHSGPLPGEISWADLEREPERTTVTGKIRRVALFDHMQAHRAVLLNRPSQIALTFLDYLFDVEGMTTMEAMPKEAVDYLQVMQESLGVPITMVGTGPQTVVRVRP